MFVIVNRFLLRKAFNAIALWPFIILKEARYKKDTVLMNHERIHLRQQLELWVVFFYVWYLAEYLVRLIQYKDRHQAYKNISFEREAYAHEGDFEYLKGRRYWGFFRYL